MPSTGGGASVSLSPQQDAAYAQKMLNRAERILGMVDESFIIKERGHAVRAMPTFRPEEISLGKTLGTGGFGIVNEIRKFTLDKDEEISRASTQDDSEQSISNSENGETGKKKRIFVKQDSGEVNDMLHYDVDKARKFMQRKCHRAGEPRYAIKMLHGRLSEFERARGMIDMAVEAKYLSVVWHPNIVKMRGMASGDLVSGDFFIILDRLFGTLTHRMNEWHADKKKNSGKKFLGGLGKNKDALKKNLVDRMTVAYDLAAAFFYLHENRLVYRDIKPENIGFDIRGDVKVFDFGLCKDLSPKLRARDGSYGYRLTGRAGSLPYMAPEVCKMDTYDSKCDVFSFAILLWEILALKPAFPDYGPTQFLENVVIKNERLPVDASWPPLTRLVIPESWDALPNKRPDMKRIAILIRADLNDMTSDEAVRRRTEHMGDRTIHSMGGDSDWSD